MTSDDNNTKNPFKGITPEIDKMIEETESGNTKEDMSVETW